MTERELRRLSRVDLLELLLKESKENEKLRMELEEARKQLASREIQIDTAGSIAEAALRLNGVFEAAEQVAVLDNDSYQKLWSDAQAYNQTLTEKSDRYTMTDEERAEYESLLNVSGNGIIGYIEIPKINCSLPIYHGTDKSILQIAVGHIEGTSLPTGGAGTHCVLSGHRGLPSARLFTDLDQLIEGDAFMIRILDEILTYEVDQILIVKPEEMDALEIEEGKDYCTLVTCTPYGVNSHRLLVRGHRVENEENLSIRITADAMQIDPLIIAPLIAVPLLLLLLIILLTKTHRTNIQKNKK